MAEPIIVRLETAGESTAEGWIWCAVSKWRWMVLTCMAVAAGAAVAVSFFLDAEYEATAVVAYTQEGGASALSNLVGGLGGLSALAGLRTGASDNGALARAMLESRVVAQQLIQQHNMLPKLYPRKWDEVNHRWRSGATDEIPTPLDGAEKFLKKVLTVELDKVNAQIKVHVRWSDRVEAAAIANDLIAAVNKALRDKASAEAARNLGYLDAEIRKTDIVEIQDAIHKLMEEQLKNTMLASVREDYALTILDPAVAPNRRDIVWPRKSYLAATGALVGLLFGSALAILLAAYRSVPPLSDKAVEHHR